MSLHIHGHPAQPLEQVQLMGGLVDQHAAALPGPGSSPGAGIVVFLGSPPAGDHPAHPADIPDGALLQNGLHLLVKGVHSLVKHHAEHQLWLLGGRGVHLFDLVHVNAGGFFHHHVEVPLQGCDGHLRVQVVGNRDHHRVHLAAVQQVQIIVIDFYICGQVLLCPVSAALVDVAHRAQAGALDAVIHKPAAVAGSHVADADHTKTYFVHIV